MHLEWLATEHYRLHRVEEWPDSPHKDAALSAIRSSLASLERNLPADVTPPSCEICLNRKPPAGIVEFPLEISQNGNDLSGLAA